MKEKTEYFEHSFAVDSAQAGERLDRILAKGWPNVSRSVWQSRIENQEVLVNAAPVKASHRPARGDAILFRFERRREPEVNTNYAFLHGIEPEDCIIALSKPPDLPVHPSGIYFRNTLTELLRAKEGPDFPLHLVHRIDRETSGLLLLARDKATAAQMQKILQNSSCKEYLVFVEGSFPEGLEAEGWIGRHPQSSVKKQMHFAWKASRTEQPLPAHFTKGELINPKSCHTDFARLGEAQCEDGSRISVLRARLHTGRMHQIRASLHSLGFPVVGDRLYGIDPEIFLRRIRDLETEEDRKRLRIGRSALHSWRITFPHPKTGAEVRLHCPLADDLLQFAQSLAGLPQDCLSVPSGPESRAKGPRDAK